MHKQHLIHRLIGKYNKNDSGLHKLKISLILI